MSDGPLGACLCWWAGGRPTLSTPCGCSYIGRNQRVNGVLAISRALGDHMLKDNNVVSAEPYCLSTCLEEQDRFLLLACDGVRSRGCLVWRADSIRALF